MCCVVGVEYASPSLTPHSTLVPLLMTSRDMSFADVSLTIGDPAGSAAPESLSEDEVQEEDGSTRQGVSRTDSCCRNTLAFLFLFYNMTLNLFVLAVVHERVPSHIKEPLPDIAFDILPKADWTLSIAEYVIIVQFAAVFIFLLFLHRYRYVFDQSLPCC